MFDFSPSMYVIAKFFVFFLIWLPVSVDHFFGSTWSVEIPYENKYFGGTAKIQTNMKVEVLQT